MNPGSQYGGAKRWLPERFAEAADRLVCEVSRQTSRNVRVAIVGASGEEAVGCAIADWMKTPPVELGGKTTIRQLMAVVKRCDVFLTNDTGPMHIAAACGVPLVAVFGSTDWRRTSPFGSEEGIVRHPVDCAPCLLRECPIDHRCMTRVTVEQVVEAAMRQLKSRRSESRRSQSSENLASDLKTFRLDDMTTPLKGIPIFLDRDGTVNRETGYIKAPDELELFPDAAVSIARLNRAGAVVVLLTNQSGVGRGLLTVEDLERIHARLRALLESKGATLDAIYYCPHHPDDGCACRKPGTAMVNRAVEELGLDPSPGYLIGDQARDIELARKIGLRGILVTTGPTSDEAKEMLRMSGSVPDHVAGGLGEAVDWIMEDAKARSALKVKH